MKKKAYHISIATFVLLLLQITILSGCSNQNRPEKTEESVQSIEFVNPTEPTVAPEPEKPFEPIESSDSEPVEESKTGRQDGEKFEETIMLEGMEELVKYEHVKNFGIGFEMDYEYESLVRQKEEDGERFVSVYDDPKKPQNYLEITYIEKVLESAVLSVSEELSNEYDIVTEQDALEKAGSCTKITTINAKSGTKMQDSLQTAYILPAGDGSIVARAHYTIESAEGFGSRFDSMMNTLEVIGRTAESSLSSDQALEAIKNYCYANIPDLEAMSGSDDYTIYWDVSTNEEGEIVVLFRSYTGAQIRYHIDPDSGETYVTELVPGIEDEERRTDENFNIKEFIN